MQAHPSRLVLFARSLARPATGEEDETREQWTMNTNLSSASAAFQSGVVAAAATDAAAAAAAEQPNSAESQLQTRLRPIVGRRRENQSRVCREAGRRLARFLRSADPPNGQPQ